MSKEKALTSLAIVGKYFDRKGITDVYSEIPVRIHLRGKIVPIRESFSIFPSPVENLIVEYASTLNYLPTDVRSYHVSLSRARADLIENMDCIDNVREIMEALIGHWGFRDSTGFYPLDGTILLAGNMKDVLFHTFNLLTSDMFKYLFNFLPFVKSRQEMKIQPGNDWAKSASDKLFWLHFSYYVPGSGTNQTLHTDRICSGIIRNCDSNIHLANCLAKSSDRKSVV